jgi:16S rRNA processing protein RimM
MQEKIEIGKIINTFGIKGEIKVYPYNNLIDEVKELTISNKKYEIEKIRYQKNIAIIKLKGLDDISEAEKFKGTILEIDKTEAPELPENTFYVKDIIGLDVYTDEGKYLGKIDDVFNTGANDIYSIGEILLPATEEVIKQIDIENKKMIVHILKGLL